MSQNEDTRPFCLERRVAVFRGAFYAEAQFCAEIPEISDTRGVLGRWGLPHCGEIFAAGLVSPKYHACILHLMKNAAKMTVVNAVKMMARVEMHFSWENFGISNLIKFDILHIFTEHDDDENDQMVVLLLLWQLLCLIPCPWTA